MGGGQVLEDSMRREISSWWVGGFGLIPEPRNVMG